MDEDASVSKERSWGFRRSTIARREFLEAVGTVLNSPPSPCRGARQSRGRGKGRGRGRGRGKQVNEAGVISAAPKRGRGGRRPSSESLLAPAEEKYMEDEAYAVSDGPHCVVADLKPDEMSASEETVSERAEDSDDLSLEEIRKRAISRQMQELRPEDNVKAAEFTAGGFELPEQEDLDMLNDTEFSSKDLIEHSPSGREDNDNSDSVENVWKDDGGPIATKRAKLDFDNEEAGDKIHGDALCSICQQTMENRFLICCDSCQKWHHPECAGISKAQSHLSQKTKEHYICTTCSEEDKITRKIRNANKVSTFTAIVSETLDEQKEEPEMILDEKMNEVKEEIRMLEEVKEAFPKCIGPGCSNIALPESVYCGHQCIVQHAAMAMKSLSEVKPETKPALPPTKPLIKIQKRSFLAKLFKVKISGSPSPEKKVGTQEIVKEDSVGCAEVPDPEQQPSTATVQDKPIIKEQEVKLSANTQSDPSDMTVHNAPSEKIIVALFTTKDQEDKSKPSDMTLDNAIPEKIPVSLTTIKQQEVELSANMHNNTLNMTLDSIPPEKIPVVPSNIKFQEIESKSSDMTLDIAPSKKIPVSLPTIKEQEFEMSPNMQNYPSDMTLENTPPENTPVAIPIIEEQELELSADIQINPSDTTLNSSPPENIPVAPLIIKEQEHELSFDKQSDASDMTSEKALPEKTPGAPGIIKHHGLELSAHTQSVPSDMTFNNAPHENPPVAPLISKEQEVENKTSDVTIENTSSEKTPVAALIIEEQEIELNADMPGNPSDMTLDDVPIENTPLVPQIIREQEVELSAETQSGSLVMTLDNAPPENTCVAPPINEEQEIEFGALTQSNSSIMTLDNALPETTSVAPPIKKSIPARARKTMPGSPRLEILRGTLSKTPRNFIVESNRPSDIQPTLNDNAMAPLSSLLQVRQNIRSSITKVLLPRINYSDHCDTEKLAVNLEKDMFNMYYTTDELYKDKCQNVILSLKNPKNKELCHQLLKGEVSSVKLINLIQQDINSVEDVACEPDVHQMSLEKESSSHSQQMMKSHPVCQEKMINVKSTNTRLDKKSFLSQRKQNLARKMNSDVPDIISNMLKDTTLQHKCHLFDLNCKICTGHIYSDGDPESKKLKIEAAKDNTEEKSLGVDHVIDEVPPPPEQDSNVTESPASPSSDDCKTPTLSEDFSPVLIPSVPIVTISRRDPRTAQFRQFQTPCTETKSVLPKSELLSPTKNIKESLKEKAMAQPSSHMPVPVMPKSILMKPSPPSDSRLDTSNGSCSSRLTESLNPSDKGTRHFLSKQDTVWKGFLNMPSVAKFVTKGYLISGSPEFLKEDLPDTIQIGGRILPQTVWEYVDLIKTSEGKEMSLIRFHPGSEEEEVAYVSLFSYFNSRRRFGVISNICKRIKDLYLIPLCAKQAIPAVLLPIDGPGLEQNHPNLLIGLAVCQKPKRPEAFLQEVGQKKPSILIHSDGSKEGNKKEINIPTTIKTLEIEIGQNNQTCGSDVLIKTSLYPDPSYFSSSKSCSSVLSQLEPVTCENSSRDSFGTTPLQTILVTLFGQKKQNPDATKCEMSSATDNVQQVQQTCKEANTVEMCDDRPYDPEEYDPALTYGDLENNCPTKVADDDDRPYDPEEEYNAVEKGGCIKNDVPESLIPNNTQGSSTVNSDIAYDPEDETVFEEMQNYLAGNAIPPKKINICDQDKIVNTTLSEQQKILEELNRQIEEQKRQLEVQTETLRLQKEAIGLSMAHFSVSNALMSPPPNFGRDDAEENEKLYYPPTINEIRDPPIFPQTSRDFEDAPEDANNETATLILTDMKENKTAVTSSLSNKEKLEYEKTLNKGSSDNETVQSHDTTRSRSEQSRDAGCGIRSRNRSDERRSDRHDRASSSASYKSTLPKNADRHHRSRRSKDPSRRGESERRQLTSRKKHDHQHRDSSSSSRYKRRSDSSPGSHSSRRERSSKDDSNRSVKTIRQLPSVHSAQSSQPFCKQPLKGLNTKTDAYESSQRPNTFQKPGKDSLNNNRNGSKINTKINHSPTQGLIPIPYMHNINTFHSDTEQLVDSTRPTFHSPQTQADISHYEKKELSNQRSQNHPANFTGSNHGAQKKGLSLKNSLQNEADRLPGAGDCPPRASSQLQHRDLPQLNNSQVNYMDGKQQELPQNRRRQFPADCSGQLKKSRNQEGFAFGERDQFNKQMLPNHRPSDQKDYQWSQEQRPPQLHGFNDEEPEINHFHQKVGRSYLKGQDLHRDETSHFEQQGSILGPTPVDMDTFRQRPLNPLHFDKCAPTTDPQPILERRRLGQPRIFHSSTFVKTVEPGGSFPGSSAFPDYTDTHSASHHTMKGPGSIEGPSERLHHLQLSNRTSLEENTPYRRFQHYKRGRFHEGHSNTRGLSHQQLIQSLPPHDPYETQTFDNAESFWTETSLPQQSEPYPKDSTCETSTNMFERQQPPEIKGQPREHQQFGFRRQGGRFLARGLGVNAQRRGARFDSLNQFKNQRPPSPKFHDKKRPLTQSSDNFEGHDESQSSGFPNKSSAFPKFKRPEHRYPCESQNSKQHFEFPAGQTSIRPLRLSGPLLPTPAGFPIRPNNPSQGPQAKSRAQGLVPMGHLPVTNDISGPWFHEDRTITGHYLNPHENDTSESLVNEEQGGEFEDRMAHQSVMDSHYGQPSRGTRGRNSRRRVCQRRRFGNSHRERDYSM